MTFPDVWGAIYRAQYSGRAAAHDIERDDGRVEVLASAENYFNAPRSPLERELLDRLEGPVLDLAAGAGSYTLYLQERGVMVTAADHSAGAIEVCKARGCQNVISIDIRSIALAPGAFGSIIVMGNTLGAHQTPETLPILLRTLRSAVRANGRLLFTTIDPLDTKDEGHLAYQQRNREQGRPPGLIRMRIRYAGMAEDWMSLWMLTDAELAHFASETGWTVIEERRHGPWRTRLLERL